MPRQTDIFIKHQYIEATLASKPSTAFEEYGEDALDFSELEVFLDRLPTREVDLVHMYYCLAKKQKEIATFFGITQGAVSHRLKRARKRLIFLRDMPKIEDKELKKRLGEALNEVDAAVAYSMVITTCQTKTAAIVNKELNIQLTQVKVKHRFEKSVGILSKLAETDTRFSVVSQLLSYINNGGLYMLHEVKLSHFDRGPSAVLDMANSI